MTDTVQIRARRGAPEWSSVVGGLGLQFGESVVVIGDRARGVAAAYQAAGGPPVAYDRPGFAYLGAAPPEADLGQATAAATGLADASVAMVSLRRAWHDASGLGAAVAEAARILRPGGGLLLADLSVDQLLNGPRHHYPAQVVYSVLPEARRLLLARRLPPTDLAVRAVAARFQRVTQAVVDEHVAEFADAAGYVEFLITDGADRLAGVDPSSVDAALEEIAATIDRLVPLGVIVEREPWDVVAATKAA